LAVRIRLTRVGATKRPSYRVVAIDSRRPRDGRALEILGFYNPLTEPATVQLDGEKLSAWLAKGAQPSETVTKLMRQAGLVPTAATATKPAKTATRRSKSGEAKATK
jgi:small subunit ribosomal protein S16